MYLSQIDIFAYSSLSEKRDDISDKSLIVQMCMTIKGMSDCEITRWQQNRIYPQYG